MPHLNSLYNSEAFLLWNQFLSSNSNLVPFSFNPSLFDFYVRYFHWKPFYILVASGGETIAVCPLVYTGKSWVSLPHFSYGGLLMNKNQDNNISITLMGKLISLIRHNTLAAGFYQIDLQDILEFQATEQKFFTRTTHLPDADADNTKVSSLLPLPDNMKRLCEALSGNLRRKLNKAEKYGLEIKIGEIELLVAFYTNYAQKMHQLGSPTYGKTFFKTLMESWQFGETKIFLALKEKKVIGTAFLQSYLGFYENTWFATDEKCFKCYVSDYMHEQMVKHAIENNGKYYSFGRSTIGSGVYHYKNHWPVEDLPIYQFGENSRLKKHPEFGNLWKIIPRFIIQPLGPYLIKHIY